jgi:hypothetical protein
MRIILAATAALVVVSGTAWAGDDIMANYYGNTVVGKTMMGETHTYYNADHTFTGRAMGMGQERDYKGTWNIDATGQLCRTYVPEPPMPGMPNPVCLAWTAHKVGDTWTATTARGSVDVSLVKGIQ